MKIRTPYYFKDFKCTASKCTDTCCAGWEIVIDSTTFDKYKKVSSDFGKRLNSEITFYEDDEPGFILKDGNCPFLNKNLLCDIYTELGEDSLCHTCKTFPRIIEEYGSLREMCISLACPEACRLILKDDTKVTFDLTENDEFVTTYNDISPELYINILNCRPTAFNIIKNSDISLHNRMLLVLNFAHEIQDQIDSLELSKINEIRTKYSNEDFLNELLQSFGTYKNKIDKKYNNVLEMINALRDFENINDKWPEYLDNIVNTFYDNKNVDFYKESHEKFDEFYKAKEYEYENLLMYFTFRYFAKSILDADVLAKVKLTVMSYIIIKELDVVTWIKNGYSLDFDDQIELTHTYSKQFEHSETNIERLFALYNENEAFDLEKFFTILMN